MIALIMTGSVFFHVYKRCPKEKEKSWTFLCYEEDSENEDLLEKRCLNSFVSENLGFLFTSSVSSTDGRLKTKRLTHQRFQVLPRQDITEFFSKTAVSIEEELKQKIKS